MHIAHLLFVGVDEARLGVWGKAHNIVTPSLKEIWICHSEGGACAASGMALRPSCQFLLPRKVGRLSGVASSLMGRDSARTAASLPRNKELEEGCISGSGAVPSDYLL